MFTGLNNKKFPTLKIKATINFKRLENLKATGRLNKYIKE